MNFFSAFGVELIADASHVHSRLQPFRLEHRFAGVCSHSENIRTFDAFFRTIYGLDLDVGLFGHLLGESPPVLRVGAEYFDEFDVARVAVGQHLRPRLLAGAKQPDYA